MTDASAAARGGRLTLLGQAARFLTQMVGLVTLSRLLSPADFGLVALISAITGVAIIIGDGGLSFAALRARELTNSQQSNLFWLNLALGTALSIAVALAAPVIAATFGQPALLPLTAAVAVVFFLNGATTQFRTRVNRSLRFGTLAAIDVAAQVVGLCIAIMAALAGAGSWSLIFQQIGVAAVSLIAYFCAARWLPSRPRRRVGTAALVWFGVHTLGSQLLNYVSTNAPVLLIGRVAEPAQVGQYSRAFNLSSMPMAQLGAPLTRVSVPILARAETANDMHRRLASAQMVLYYPIIAALGAMAALAPSLVWLLMGNQWGGAVIPLQVLSLAAVFQCLDYPHYWAYMSSGRMSLQLALALGPQVGSVILIACIAHIGSTAVAWAVVAGQAGLWLLDSTIGMRSMQVRVITGLSIACKSAVPLLVAFSASALVCAPLVAERQYMTALLVGICTYAVAWAGTVAVVAPLRRDVRRVAALILSR